MRYATWRVDLDPPPLDGPRTAAELRAAAGPTITPDGIGGLEALRIFADVLAPACISVDHPRFLSFVPAAPTEASILFDLVVGASSIYGGSWLEGGGAVFAENEALRWIADLAGLPATAGGVFVSGGTAGNLSALIAARWHWRRRAGGPSRPDARAAARVRPAPTRRSPRRPGRWTPTWSLVPADARRPAHRRRRSRRRSTALDDDDSRPAVRRRRHVRHDERRRHRRPHGGRRRGRRSCARGCTSTAPTAAPPSPRRASATASPASRPPTASSSTRTSGCSRRSTRAPCSTATRRSPARPTPSTPSTSTCCTPTTDVEWNASDYAHHLSRRARGLPLWFSLATHGTEAYTEAIETTLRVAREGADLVARRAPPRAAPRAGAVGRAVPPDRLGRRPATRRGATGSWRASSRSSRRRRGAARPCCAGASSTR